MCKGTGRNGRRKNIGTDTVNKAMAGTIIKAAEGMVTETVTDTKKGVKWIIDWDLMFDQKIYFSLYQVA
jgi:hypothetical protein